MEGFSYSIGFTETLPLVTQVIRDTRRGVIVRSNVALRHGFCVFLKSKQSACREVAIADERRKRGFDQPALCEGRLWLVCHVDHLPKVPNVLGTV